MKITRTGSAPIAEEDVRLIRELYAIEAEIRGIDPDDRRAAARGQHRPWHEQENGVITIAAVSRRK